MKLIGLLFLLGLLFGGGSHDPQMQQSILPILAGAGIAAGAAASYLGSKSGGKKDKLRIPPASKTEKQIRKSIKRLEPQQTAFLEQLLQQSSGQQGFFDELVRRLGAQQTATEQLLPAESRGFLEADQLRNVYDLGFAEDDALQRALAFRPELSSEQQARIAASADSAIGAGLSDLGRFRDQTFDQIRQNSAARGLRPTDTPILNEFTESGEEFGRQAEQLVRGIRGRQAELELDYPLQAGDLGLRQIGAASDIASRRRLFEAGLAEQSLQNRLALGTGIQARGLQFASQTNPASLLPSFLAARFGAASSGGGGGAGFDAGSALGGAGALLQGIGALRGTGGAAGSTAGGASSFFSDERLKEDVEELDSEDVLRAIRSVRFRYTDPAHGEGEQIGLFAQDLQKAGLGFAVEPDPQSGFLQVHSGKLAAAALALTADMSRRLERQGI